MKNFIIILGILITYLIIGNTAVEAVKIPDEAIRLRVVANSDSKEDQTIKLKVKTEVEKELFNLLKNTKGIEEARNIINDNLDTIDNKVNSLLLKEKYRQGYELNFGYNYFPEKEFNGITYEEGMYESLLITLGKGEGENWWCVLFPPLCLLEAEESDEVEYKLFIQELIEKYL